MDQGGGQWQTKLGKWEKKILPWLIQKQVPRIRPAAMRGLLQAIVFGLMPPGAWPEMKGIKWSAKEFLGRSPTPAESVALTRALDDLEEAGLIKRTHNRGKGKRTSHIKLTKEGIQQSGKYLNEEEFEILILFLSAYNQMRPGKPFIFDNNSPKDDI